MVRGLGLGFVGIQSESVNQTGAGDPCSRQTQCARDRDLGRDRAGPNTCPGEHGPLNHTRPFKGNFNNIPRAVDPFRSFFGENCPRVHKQSQNRQRGDECLVVRGEPDAELIRNPSVLIPPATPLFV